MLSARAFLLGSFLACLLSASANAGVIFSQPTNFFGGNTSINDTGGLGNVATVDDDFSLGSAVTVQAVTFVGVFQPGKPRNDHRIYSKFWDDSGAVGDPGSVLFTETLSGNANESSLAFVFLR